MRTRDCVELKSLDPLAYYATQSPITDPGKYVELFADLPGTIGDLCRVVQGLCIHYRAGEAYGYEIPKERLSEIESRYLEKMLAGSSNWTIAL